MGIIKFALTAFASLAVGVFGFSQIIGSIQNAKTKGAGMTAFTISLWAAILIGSYFLMMRIVPGERITYFIAMAVAMVLVLRSGKIE